VPRHLENLPVLKTWEKSINEKTKISEKGKSKNLKSKNFKTKK
jgi:hypothetical protein